MSQRFEELEKSRETLTDRVQELGALLLLEENKQEDITSTAEETTINLEMVTQQLKEKTEEYNLCPKNYYELKIKHEKMRGERIGVVMEKVYNKHLKPLG